jgi:IS30 family transposase
MKRNTFQVEYNMLHLYLRKALQFMNKFTQLSYQERRKIYSGLCEGKYYSEIAKELERSVSTISREIGRNSDRFGYLYPADAHKNALGRKHINEVKLKKNNALRDYVIIKLREKWSPKSIAGKWNLSNAQKISQEAIYQWIYSDDGESLGLKYLLVRARKKRGLRRKVNKSKINNRVSVHDRPENINQRDELGHYECDLIFNVGSQSKNICTLVERVTRNTILIHNKSKHTDIVIGSLIARIKELNLDVKSITFDNGSEFASHSELNKLGIKTYFCDPGSPWQKGSIENLNGFARRFLPFSLPAVEIDALLVKEVNHKINLIPRAILAYKSPFQVFSEATTYVH